MKITKLIIFLSILSSCAHFDVEMRPVITNIYVQEFPSKSNITQGLSIVMSEFVKEGLFTHKQMADMLHNKNMTERHKNCRSTRHQLRIIFSPGVWSEKDKSYCIYSSYSGLEGKCLIGLFNGRHTIYMVSRGSELYNTAFAHELFHYFQSYSGDKLHRTHEPEKLWLELFGFRDRYSIGRINKELKKQGL